MRRLGGAALGVTAALVVLRLWIMPLPSSLWLDEFGTVWVTDGGLGRVVERARLFPQSVPYGALVAVVRGAAGTSEWALRLPSLAAMLAAALLVGRLGRACFGGAAGLLSAGIFLLFPAVEFAAADARPYAFAVLFSTAALLALRAWLERGRARDAAAYVAAAAAAVYFHYLFAASLAGHAACAIWRRRRGSPVTSLAMVLAAASLAVVLVPAAILVAGIGHARAVHAFGAPPGLLPLVNALLPVRVLGLLLPAVGLALLLGGRRGSRDAPAAGRLGDAVMLLVPAALAPPVLLFAASRALHADLFEGRYLLASAAPWAALLGGAVARLVRGEVSRLAVAGSLLLALLVRGELGRIPIAHGREDWRGAIGRLREAAPGAPILLGGSFAEAQDASLVASPAHQAYLTEPVRYYAPDHPVRALPLGGGERMEGIAGTLAAPALAERRFALVERHSRYPSWAPWLDAAARPRGYAPRELYRGGPLVVRLYERAGP